MPTIFGIFQTNGIPRDNATAKLWSAGDFTTPPSSNTDIPTGNCIASATTGPAHGCNGAYRFTSVASGEYYVSVDWNGTTTYDYHLIADGTGLGWVLASNYSNLQQAINATPSGGTLFIPQGTYTISGATYNWTHNEEGAKTGLVVQDKPINIRGAGYGTIICPGASGVQCLTMLTTSGCAVANRVSRTTVADIRFDNPNSFASCTGLVYDRGVRNRVRDVIIGYPSSSGFAVGLKIKSSYIFNVTDCYVHNCTIGIDATTAYSDFGASNALTIQGGEVQGNGRGICVSGAQMCSFSNTCIEGNTVAGVDVSGCIVVRMTGNYWEHSAGIPDVRLFDSTRAVYIEGISRFYARNAWDITLDRFRELRKGQGSLFDIDDTVGAIKFTSWEGEDSVSFDAASAVWKYAERGYLVNENAGEPKSIVYARQMVGDNLTANPELVDSGAGWLFSNMAVTGTAEVFGLDNIAYTTSAVSGTTCTIRQVIPTTFENHLRGKHATLTIHIKVPDQTWYAQIQLVDGVRNKFMPVPSGIYDGNWHSISCTFRIDDAATGLQPRLDFHVGSSGTAYAAGFVCTVGGIPIRPAMSPTNLPQTQTRRRLKMRLTGALGASGQIDPTLAAVQLVSGNGGAVTITTGQAFFSQSGSAFDGFRVTVMGTHDTNTVSLVSGGSTGLRLKTSPRVLGKGDSIGFIYSNTNGLWSEI